MTAAERVVEAWTNPGPVPAYHYEAQSRLARDWPTLAQAIQELVTEHQRPKGSS